MIPQQSPYLYKASPIVLITCAAYHDAAKITAEALAAYWVSSREKIVITESPNFAIPGWKTIVVPSAKTWGDRLRQGLQHVAAPFVILLFDDFTPEALIDDKQVSAIERCMIELQADVVYLHYPFFDERFRGKSTLQLQRVQKDAYAINSAPAVWKVRALEKTLHPDDTPWTWETFAMYRRHNRRLKIYTVPSTTAIYPYALTNGGLIQGGMYNLKVLERYVSVFGDRNVDTGRSVKQTNRPKKRSFWANIKLITAGIQSTGPAALLILKYYAVEKMFRAIRMLQSRKV